VYFDVVTEIAQTVFDRERELRPLVPDNYQVKITRQEEYVYFSHTRSLSLSHTCPNLSEANTEK
jgi:hypothetical protein